MTIINNKTAAINRDLSYAEQRLGTDIKLTNSGDIELTSTQDVKLVAGVANAAQAFKIKLDTEVGGNRYHPSIGVDAPIGDKSVSAFVIRNQIIRSLSQDERFSNVSVFIKIIGNTYLVDIKLTVINRTIQIPLQFIAETV